MTRSRPSSRARVAAALGVGFALVAALALAACGPSEDVRAPEPLPADPAALTPTMEALLIENQSGCRENEDCDSGICRFGACLALVRLDAPWQVAVVMGKAQAVIAAHPDGPELRRRVVATLARLVDEGAALAFRARAIQGLEALGEAPEIARRFDALPMPLQEQAAVALTRLGDPKGLALCEALTESEALPVAIEAVRALGASRRTEALPVLLSLLALDVPTELQRAAVDAMHALGDPRAIGPLAAWLRAGPESLGDRVATALRDLARPDAPLPADPDRWDAWLAAHAPPAAPPYTPRTAKTSPDEDLLPEP